MAEVTSQPNVKTGIPLPKKFSLLDKSNKGKFIIKFENPRLSAGIILSKGGFVDKVRGSSTFGKRIQYIGITGEPEDIHITAPRFELDLSDEFDRKKKDYILKYDILKNCKTKCTIIDTTVAAAEKVSKRDKEYELVEAVKQYLSDPAKLTALALNLGGIDTDGVTPAEVKEQVYDRVRDDADGVKSVLNDPDFDLKAMLRYAKIKKVLDERTIGSFYYGNNYLGANLEQAVQWCRDHPNEYTSIINDCNKVG